MKLCDIAFGIAALINLSVLAWNKVAVESLISGVMIGGYIGWRIWHDNK